MSGEEPVSIHQIPISFVANHIFKVSTNAQYISASANAVLTNIKTQEKQIELIEEPTTTIEE